MDCPICYQEMRCGSHDSVCTPCGHRFHNTCITKWAYSDPHKDKPHVPCPMCRCDIDMVQLLFGGLFADVTESLFGDEPFYLSFG